jgi:hypothetical protein
MACLGHSHPRRPQGGVLFLGLIVHVSSWVLIQVDRGYFSLGSWMAWQGVFVFGCPECCVD